MPQISPLNWIMLIMLFIMIKNLISSIIMSKNIKSTYNKNFMKMKKNKWTW